MSITVNKFMVSNDLSTISLDVDVTSGQTITQILLWDQDSYKDPSKSVDLSSLLSGSTNSEVFDITAANAKVANFKGIYLLQITTSEPEAIIVATLNLTQYYIVQAKLIANIDLSCLNCNSNFQNSLLFDMYLEATKQSLVLGRFQDAIDNLKKLIITIDTSTCDDCNDIEAVVSTAGNIVSIGVIDCLLTTTT
ncbi:hypothetical protein [Clostridium sp.]|jgi:hypothetical protein|uniref:hypothetical protein n=1 Tax=Clostridium sp. TaxID=1506 RepID=UPI003EE9AE38